MSRALVLALLLAILPGSLLAPSQPITAHAPFEIWADGFGSVRGIVVDAGNAVHVADREGGTVTRIDQDGRRVLVADHLERPVGLALDRQGRLLVAEERGGRVMRLDPTGRTVVARGIAQPRWLAMSENGTLYISARRLRPDVEPELDDESIEPEVILALTPDGALSVFADGFARLQGLAVHQGAVYAATTGLRGAPRQEGVVYRIPVMSDGRAGSLAPMGPGGVFQSPIGVAVDRLGALYISAPVADPDGLRTRQAIVKLHPSGGATLFAASLDAPRGLAFDSHGHLYVADGGSGRVLRFLAPPAPVLAGLPRFTNQATIALTGSTVPDARVDVFINHGVPPLIVTSTASGTFGAAITPVANAENGIAVRATAARGDGLTSPAAVASLVHDAIAPVAVFQTPAAGGFVRGLVPIRADAADAGSDVATLDVSAAGRALGAAIAPPLPAPAVAATASWPTGDVPDGTHTLTATATDQAGNRVTVSRVAIVDNTAPDTEITAGPSGPSTQPTATFAFTGIDNLAPAASLLFACRLDGGVWGAFSSATTITLTDLAPGSHHFEVTARDLAGNEDPTPASRTFVLAPAASISIAISEPLAGAAVAVGSVLVRGTVNAGSDDASVSVNGFAALVHGSQWAAEIPAVLGSNVITALAASVAGDEATASLVVNGNEGAPGVFFGSEPSSGVAPLQVTWQVTSRLPRPLVKFELDPAGGGTFGDPVTVLDGTQSTYPDAGLMFPTVRVTDDLGQVHVATTVVQVADAQTASTRFQTLWAGFKGSLQAGDEARALTYLSPALRARFAPILQQLGPDLSMIAAGLGPIELIDEVDNLAEAAIVQVENGAPRLYFIYFRRDNRGRWLIQEM